ncbi:MAG: hypothetical protein ACM3KR_07495 [Deltaproteobacteria bacterium]
MGQTVKEAIDWLIVKYNCCSISDLFKKAAKWEIGAFFKESTGKSLVLTMGFKQGEENGYLINEFFFPSYYSPNIPSV